MQALLLFVLYGFFYAVILSFMHTGAQSTLALRAQKIEGTKQYFKDIEKVITRHIIPTNLTIPNLGNNIDAYLEDDDLKKSVNWNFGINTTTDPWRTAFTGYVLHERQVVRAQSGGGNVTLPITAILLVSAGPDKVVDSALTSQINSLTSSSDMRNLMNIEATQGTDDIVHSFTTYNALQDRWRKVESRVEEIALQASKQYRRDTRQFEVNLINRFGAAYLNYYDSNGALINSDANRIVWVANGVGLPADMGDYDSDINVLGVHGALEMIEDDTNLTVRLQSFDAGSGITSSSCTGSVVSKADALRVCIVNNGSPWGTSSGTLFYYKDVIHE